MLTLAFGFGEEAMTNHAQPEKDARSIRLLSFNVLGARGFPLDGKRYVAFDESSPDLISELAVRIKQWNIDIVILQEAPPESIVRHLASLAGMEYAYFSPQSIPGPDYPFGFPGAVLSRFELLEAIPWAGRDLAVPTDHFHRHWGQVTAIVKGQPLRIASFHLCADWGGVFREATRLGEIEIFLQNTNADIVAGDFNSAPDSLPWRKMTDAGWRDAWLEAGSTGPGYTSHPLHTNARIDYVWLAPDASWTVGKAIVVDQIEWSFEGRSMALSDHFPVIVDVLRKR